MKSKDSKSTVRQGAPTPWDIVNVFGYALGVDRPVLDYTARKESKYNFQYCEGRKSLRALRESCLLRRAIMEQYDELAAAIAARGHVYLPVEMLRSVPEQLYESMRKSTSVEDMMCKAQFRINELLPAFEREVPTCRMMAIMLSGQFSLGWRSSQQSLEDWCHNTVRQLGREPYLYSWESFSTRFLRDDRDLVEELYTYHGKDPSEYPFPYPRNKSNRRAHMERAVEFCNQAGSVVVELDTENTEAALAIAFIQGLEQQAPGAIKQVNVYLGGMESRTWRHLSEFISSKVCVKEVTRIRNQKSAMDTAIIASIANAKYREDVGGVLLVSSDCDFLVLSTQLPDLPVCYCCTRKQASAATLKYLRDRELPSVYLDYVVNNRMAERVERECVKAHVAMVIRDSIPNIKELVPTAVREVCPQSRADLYSDDLCGMLGGINLSIKSDGTITVSITEESVE